MAANIKEGLVVPSKSPLPRSGTTTLKIEVTRRLGLSPCSTSPPILLHSKQPPASFIVLA